MSATANGSDAAQATPNGHGFSMNQPSFMRRSSIEGTEGRSHEAKLVEALGWFSLGLGAVQLIAPGAVNRLIGAPDDGQSRLVQRAVGIQELSAAAGLLGFRRVPEWLWARTAGDVLHLTMVGRTFDRIGARRGRLALTMALLTGTLAADAYASARTTSDGEEIRNELAMKATASATVRTSIEDARARWRDFEQQTTYTRLGPIEITGEDHDSIAWRTSEDAEAKASGVLRFAPAPGDRGTEISVEMVYEVPGGAVGAAGLKVAGNNPHQMVQDDLRRFKQLLETGEIARSDGAPIGHSARLQPEQRPAQPLENANLQ